MIPEKNMMTKTHKIRLIDTLEMEKRLAQYLLGRRMPDHYLYLDRGGQNWLTLEASPDFAVARKLTDLLKESISLLAGWLADHHLLSIGVGSGIKEKIILEQLPNEFRRQYTCVDVNDGYLEMAAALTQKLDIETLCIVGLFEQLGQIVGCCEHPLTLALLGNNFCNYRPDELLHTVHANLGPDDLFLFDCALLTGQADAVTAAYTSELNKVFNMAPLLNKGINPQNCLFELTLITERLDDMELCRTSKHITILQDCDITVGTSPVTFKRNDQIQMGFTYKYTAAQVLRLLEKNGFTALQTQLDNEQNNMIVLAQTRGR